MTTTKAQVEHIVSRPYAIEFEYREHPSEGVLAYVAEWPDCFAAGRTREEALQELGKARRELVAYRLEPGLAIAEPTATYSGRVLLRIPKGLHRLAERRAKSEDVSLNQWLISAIARELGPVSKRLTGASRRRSSRPRRTTATKG